MKSFLKTVLAVVVGLGVFMTLIALFFIGSLVSAAISGEGSASTKKNDVLVLKINGPVNEVEPAVPFNFSILSGFSMNESYSLRGLVRAIDLAKADKNVEGIYLNTDGMAAAPATYEALHDALVDFRAAGKWIVAYNNSYGTSQYYLASVADSIFLNPMGGLTLDGMTSVIPYFKDAADKLGVEMQIFRVGTFKSAVEPYMLDHMSDANRLQTVTYLQEIWDKMMDEVAASRGLDVDSLNAWANTALSYAAAEQLPAGLVDGLRHHNDMETIVKRMAGQKESKKFHGIDHKKMLATGDDDERGDEVAVLYAVGEIVDAAEGTELAIVGDKLSKEVDKLTKNKKLKAVVLRVNSPGGSVFASEQIWKSLMDLKASGKTIVVSMGDYAASGGYYISTPADYIVAEPNTITGSIGVFGMIPNFGGIAQKVGVNFEEVKTHEFGTLTTMRAANEAERQKIQAGIERVYDIFLGHVADSRGMTKDSVNVIAQGRVWTGTHALEIGLVDELGSLQTAVAKAVELAGIDPRKYHTKNYPETTDDFMDMFNQAEEDVTIRIADRLLGTDRQLEQAMRRIRRGSRVQAIMEEMPVFVGN